MDERVHKFVSLLVRDYTIMAKRHHDMARDCRAIAGIWRQVLDDTQPFVLKSDQGEDGKVGAPAVNQGCFLFVDDSNEVQL